MKVRNRTTLKFAPLMGKVNYPAPSVTCVVKGAFALVPGGVATLLDKQPEIEGDVLHKPSKSPLYEADLVPFKPKADLLLQATCHTPGGKAVTSCPVKFSVGQWSKELAVIGNRNWEKGLVFSKQGAAETFTQCEMHWGNAFGGNGFAENPVGKGHRDGSMPNIENPQKLVKSNGDTPHPAGFGPLNRQWKFRAGKVGSIDKKYLKERWPGLPKDFDWTYFNAAPGDQQLEGFLRGDEVISLQNLHAQHAELKCTLPGMRIRCLLRLKHEDRLQVLEVPMNLDTLHVNAQTDTISLVWRGVQNTRLEELEDVEDFLIFSEPLSAPPLDHAAVMPWFEDPPLPADPLPPPVFLVPDPAGPGKALAAALDKAAAELQAEMKAAVKVPAATKMPAGEGVFMGFAPMVASMMAMRSRLVAAGQKPPPNLDTAIREMQNPALAAAEADLLVAQAMAAVAPGVPLKGPSLAKAIRERKTPSRDYSGQDLAGQDLSGLDLTMSDFRKANLAGANLSGCKLDDCNFADADLSGANLAAAKGTRVEFSRAGLSGANLEGCAFKDATFKMANAAGANLKGADVAGASFYRGDCSNAVGLGGKFDGCDFSMARLDGADFTAASLAAATFFRATATALKLKGAKAAGLRAPEAKLPGLDAEEAALKDSVWELAQLRGANFRFAGLEGALFNSADLSTAILFGAVLRRGFLRKANMEGVMAGNADFFEANLERANLRGASLVTSNCYGAALYQAETDGADFGQALIGNTVLAKR